MVFAGICRRLWSDSTRNLQRGALAAPSLAEMRRACMQAQPGKPVSCFLTERLLPAWGLQYV